MSYWKGIYSDGGNVLSSPSRWNKGDWLKCASVLGTTGAIMYQDEKVQEFAQDKRNSMSDTISFIMTPFCSEGAIIALGGVYLGGCIAHNTRLKQVTLLCGESVLIADGIISVLKIFMGRARPDKGEGAWSYYPFNFPKSIHDSYGSFPSGHTTTAFSIASCLADECKNPWIGTIAYGAALMVGLSRINNDKHWASDVFMGGLVGISVGKTVVKLRNRKTKN